MERRLTILLNENGTVQILPEDISSNQQCWISGTFLVLGFCFGVGLGLVSLLGLWTKYSAKPLIGLQLAALLDCVQGQVLGTIFLIVKPNGDWCRISACTSTTFLVIETIEMTLLTFPPQIFLIEIFPWILGLFIAVFILTDQHQAPVNFYPTRYGCSVVSGGYGWYQMIMILILGSSWLGTALGLTHSAICRENHLDIVISRIITILYIILVLPLSLVLLTSMSNKSYYGNSTDIVESVFIWARYQFNIAVPVVVLLLNKQVRKQSESLLCWCKKNSIRQTPNRTTINNTLRNITRRKRFYKKLSYSEIKPNPTTPVLFATSNGLHLRTIDMNAKELPSTSRSSKDKSIICEPCDLSQNEKLTSKLSTLQPVVLTPDYKKNVRFASPQICDIPLTESGVWSNTEEAEALRFHSVPNTQQEINSSCELGVTYTKV